MNPIIRNILAVIAGVVVGGVVNAAIIKLGSIIIPPPPGVDPSDIESIKANIGLYEAKHFIIPFLAHALGTLFGAFIATRIGVSRHLLLALIVGIVFLAGGIMMIQMVPGPMWFNALDLLGAYFPMAFIGNRLGGGARLS